MSIFEQVMEPLNIPRIYEFMMQELSKGHCMSKNARF